MASTIVTTITTAMTSFATAVGSLITTVFNDVFMTGSGSDATISNFGVYTLVFLGIATVTGIIATVVRKVG